jgi:WXG100 family type VII secretion target
MSNLSQTEKALTKGAEAVNTARGDVKGKCNTLSDRVSEMMGGWGGQGASAFGNLMVAWQDKQEQILKALDQLSISMQETEKDNVSTDESQSEAHLNLQNRLG